MARTPVQKEKPLINHVTPDTPAPQEKRTFFQRLFGLGLPKKSAKKTDTRRKNRGSNYRRRDNQDDRKHNSSNRRRHTPRRAKQPEKEKTS